MAFHAGFQVDVSEFQIPKKHMILKVKAEMVEHACMRYTKITGNYRSRKGTNSFEIGLSTELMGRLFFT